LILVTVIFSGSVAGGVAGNTAFLDFPNEAKCRAAASAIEASERVAISAARLGQTNISRRLTTASLPAVSSADQDEARRMAVKTLAGCRSCWGEAERDAWCPPG
jgi:hypothetical protein